MVRQTDAAAGVQLLPARRISLQNETLKATLDDAHALAEWVATYDELLDKRQLQANSITVVRYRRASTNGRNTIVSSTSELRLLGVLARRRLGELGLPFAAEELAAIAERVKKDALSVSGDIVLRAAKRGVSAGEMIGLVMSRHLLEEEFKVISGAGKRPAFSVFFLLDDYADWLAQKESRIADILGLCIEEGEEGPILHVAVIESKYVAASGAAEARRSSKAQLMATLSTFRAALFGDPGRLDRDVWLARLSDLLVNADIPPGCSGLLERARAKLRDGEAGISLRGYSHVFVHSPTLHRVHPSPNNFSSTIPTASKLGRRFSSGRSSDFSSNPTHARKTHRQSAQNSGLPSHGFLRCRNCRLRGSLGRDDRAACFQRRAGRANCGSGRTTASRSNFCGADGYIRSSNRCTYATGGNRGIWHKPRCSCRIKDGEVVCGCQRA